jgi:hypothetical protein
MLRLMHPFSTLPNEGIGLYILWTIAVLFVIFKLLAPAKCDLPTVNGRRRFEIGQYQARRRFALDGRGIILNGLRKVSSLGCVIVCFWLGDSKTRRRVPFAWFLKKGPR